MRVSISVLICVGIACGEIVDINRKVDNELSAINLFNKYNNDTIRPIPGDTINENIHYSNGCLTSSATLYRTDNCSMYTSKDNEKLSFDLHIGLKFFATLFGNIVINDSDTAAFFQIEDNSVHFGITYTNSTNCTVALYALEVEKFKKVKFSVSNHEFEKFDFERLFRTEVQRKVNWILATNTPVIQSFFQKGLCNMSNGHIPSIRTILILIQNLFTKF